MAVSGKIKSIVPIYEKFSATFKLDIEQLNTEWKGGSIVTKNYWRISTNCPSQKKQKSKHQKENIPSDSEESDDRAWIASSSSESDEPDDSTFSDHEIQENSHAEKETERNEVENDLQEEEDPVQFWNYLR